MVSVFATLEVLTLHMIIHAPDAKPDVAGFGKFIILAPPQFIINSV
jgi:hypothetical protein